ncbi:asparagine synthase (glutamine-hydrolyzing) [Congregibacter litoralis]|uniref:asparagine synthase (glutamine-hydrolyzing) n=1 Tax=Congregibacter litoralis KT71 TaxID=314285 RepID=A4A561_9GAMM|nr:asparagine synthase (glutamine-hydrolyzing) [Congregibacter litoralis]EAQ98932.2 asparagine synthase (glutamine-hydrolyzing) [Congregibacter litoralis KT71]
MCGIAGFTRFHDRVGDENTLATMGEAIRHRGPDADGSYLDERVGLHHRRLAIIDLSEAGNQPMHSACGRYVVIFNGEIYNFLELRQNLTATGYNFQTKTDTEVILAAYATYGEDCLEHLNGMFAIALWDKAESSLFLARDRVGKKPLYYGSRGRDVVFASELKALMAADLIEKKIRLDAVYDFFAYQYVPDPKTIFEDVFKLEPGHYAKIDSKGIEVRQYWDISFDAQDIDETTAVAKLREQITRSTKLRMTSDVPLGAFLSGGVDSGGIVATMAKLSDKPITTCTIGFHEEEFDETSFAQIVADQYNCDHHEFKVGENVVNSLREIVSYFDEPFADPSLVPTYYVCKLARQKVTVALAGDGGDEVFAGYEKYHTYAIENLWRSLVPAFIRNKLAPLVTRALEHVTFRPLRRLATLARALSADPALGFYMTNSQITDRQWQDLATTETKAQLQGYHPSHRSLEMFAKCQSDDPMTCALYTDMKTYLPGDILVKVDRMSMANSLEVRAPLLDFELIEFAARLKTQLKYRSGTKKYILKKAFEPVIPASIRNRKKMGFSPPVDVWLRNELKNLASNELFRADGALQNIFSLSHIQKMWDMHQSGRNDMSNILWPLLIFQLWSDEYFGGNQAEKTTRFSAEQST